ncbi:MAG TPA: ATP-binding cassette domain-containing protein, partial [Kofleriaceae bacterium]|nr:ATP-binding cassette domain-containing protein [Kofleriaceae bacterium]
MAFQVSPGEVIGLLGPNGAGKTTLMKILTGYLEPDAGGVKIHGIDAVRDPIAAQRKVGYLPESAPLYGEMIVQDYLGMMAEMRGVPADRRRARILEVVRATGLTDRVVQPIRTLSKGYRQRVGLAQAIIHEPELLILDEPTTGLDPAQIVEIRDLIKRLASKTTVLLSTHILSEVEATCERVLVIMQGKLRADSKLSELRGTNAAVVAIDKAAIGVRELLEKLGPVQELGAEGDFMRWRVEAGTPELFDALRATTWKVGELRPDPKTLE